MNQGIKNKIRAAPLSLGSQDNNRYNEKYKVADTTNHLNGVEQSPAIKIWDDSNQNEGYHDQGEMPGLGNI